MILLVMEKIMKKLILIYIKMHLKRKNYITKINNSFSKANSIKTGVPQGSMLGPLLFLIYINDIAYLPLKSKIYMYADDTAIYTDNENIEIAMQDIQNDYNKIIHWLNKNKILINSKKTKFMSFCTKAKIPNDNLQIKTHEISCMNKND